MKNRKRIVVAFLLCAVMLLGIGYAALTDTLDINGSADVSDTQATEAFNEDIYFSAAVANDAADGNTADVDTGDNDKATFTVANLKGKGDTTTFTFTITNDGDVDAIVKTDLVTASDANTNPDFFKIEGDWTELELEAGESIVYKVTVTLLNTPTATIEGKFHIILTATSK